MASIKARVDHDVSAFDSRGDLWLQLMDELRPESVLEVGCGVGDNLHWITQRVDPKCVTGVDVDPKALRVLDRDLPGVRGMHAPARDIPVADRSVEFVFTLGALMHQPDEALDKVMSEMVRVSSRYVFCGESFPRDYGGLFLDLFPYELALVRQGHLRPGKGRDRVTWWLFERG
jgi:ubiquinone/menaquinone biosynthesis C-methylase UbiE